MRRLRCGGRCVRPHLVLDERRQRLDEREPLGRDAVQHLAVQDDGAGLGGAIRGCRRERGLRNDCAARGRAGPACGGRGSWGQGGWVKEGESGGGASARVAGEGRRSRGARLLPRRARGGSPCPGRPFPGSDDAIGRHHGARGGWGGRRAAPGGRAVTPRRPLALMWCVGSGLPPTRDLARAGSAHRGRRPGRGRCCACCDQEHHCGPLRAGSQPSVRLRGSARRPEPRGRATHGQVAGCRLRMDGTARPAPRRWTRAIRCTTIRVYDQAGCRAEMARR